ncbi:MAG: phytanoyl-CoA dioxygenase family protein [Candidatus Hydrogenedentes bacterium]|nr:phytanoyl-CoA dioxygenase family protein [Candidatus Hydrogenedentota bacterium]
MSTAIDSLPCLDSPYTLDPGKVAQFQRDGHALIEGLCAPEDLTEYAAAIAHAVDVRKGDLLPMEQRDTYGKAFIQIMNLWREEEVIRRYVFAKRFARAAAELMGVPAVRLYHDQALFKEGGGGATPWHQDQHYWPLDTDRTVTLWMPLIDLTPEMGSMTFASGSHTEGYFGDSAIEGNTMGHWEAFVKERGWATPTYGALRAGDATFHTGWTLHCAPENTSTAMRAVMTIIYYADGALVKAPDSKYRQADLDAWIPGGIPGQPAASPLNPILYAKE